MLEHLHQGTELEPLETKTNTLRHPRTKTLPVATTEYLTWRAARAKSMCAYADGQRPQRNVSESGVHMITVSFDLQIGNLEGGT